MDPIPDIEESIYYTLHSQKFYLQIGFPENSQLYGNVIIYQLNLRLDYNEIWISNIGAQTHQPGQELTLTLFYNHHSLTSHPTDLAQEHNT